MRRERFIATLSLTRKGGLIRCRSLAQAIAAQAVFAARGHRQPRGLLGAPAIHPETAGKFGSAAGAGKPAQARHF
jgi:hypothetical protein